MISANLSAIFYLVSGILFILALRGLSSPDTSRQGNYYGIAGMIIGILVTFLSIGNFSTSLVYVLIFMVIGGALGNLYDRIVFSSVPDFIDIHYGEFHWFIFNVADIFITIGIICLIYDEVLLQKKNNEQNF